MADAVRFERDKAALSRHIAGETVIVPVRQNVADLSSLYVLNGTASVVWQRLEAGATLDELAHAVCAEFNVAPADARADLEELLQQMQNDGLVRSAP